VVSANKRALRWSIRCHECKRHLFIWRGSWVSRQLSSVCIQKHCDKLHTFTEHFTRILLFVF